MTPRNNRIHYYCTFLCGHPWDNLGMSRHFRRCWDDVEAPCAVWDEPIEQTNQGYHDDQKSHKVPTHRVLSDTVSGKLTKQNLKTIVILLNQPLCDLDLKVNSRLLQRAPSSGERTKLLLTPCWQQLVTLRTAMFYRFAQIWTCWTQVAVRISPVSISPESDNCLYCINTIESLLQHWCDQI